MRLLAPVCVLILAAGAAAPAHAQRDTIRFGTPDTARVPATPAVPGIAAPDSIFDAPETRELVTRVMQAGSSIPAGLDDYRADMGATVYLSLRADTAQGGELPLTVDEFAGEVRWDRGGDVQQLVQGHRVRMLAPAPYTIGSMIEAPWVVPHLYGNTITVFSLSASPTARAQIARAVHPFAFRGIDFYHYRAGNRVRVTTAEGVVTLLPIEVRPRAGKLEEARDQRLVAGTFWVDVDRAAIARARFGFVERGGRFVVTETGVFFELESALVGGQY
ncbi:MAG TPA: hypothetical protein VHG93_25735, partial [Longimicrobium sp.]|nr:hypothetical protein [Longimicrobium sp.]